VGVNPLISLAANEGRLMEPSGFIEVDLFPKEVDSVEHPEVIQFKNLLEDVGREYQAELIFFDIDAGTVSFAFDSEKLTADIIKILQNESQN
jgi:hypothetical protein